jgi:hypothetical protein
MSRPQSSLTLIPVAYSGSAMIAQSRNRSPSPPGPLPPGLPLVGRRSAHPMAPASARVADLPWAVSGTARDLIDPEDREDHVWSSGSRKQPTGIGRQQPALVGKRGQCPCDAAAWRWMPATAPVGVLRSQAGPDHGCVSL